MDDVARALGPDLGRRGAVGRLAPLRAALAAIELGEPATHVDLVVTRVEALVDVPHEARLLKLAALAHELDPARVAPVLAGCRVEPEAAEVVAEVGDAFWAADLWRAGDGAGPSAWLRRAGARARLLLLFEAAHEGRLTATMSAAAELASLQGAAARWQRLLAAIR